MTSQLQRYACQAGLTATEYAVLIGLIGILSISGLTALGSSFQELIKGSQSSLIKNSTLSLIQPKTSSSSNSGSGVASSWRGGGYYAITTDPTTGQPTLTLVDGNSAAMKNVTGVEGGQLNILGTLRLAQALEKLAEAQTDPDLRAYYADMAKTAYYLGGTQGEMDFVNGLRVNERTHPKKNSLTPVEGYTAANALSDLMYYQSQLDEQLNNPPPGLNIQEFMAVMPLAAEVFNIANNYQNHFSEQLQADGSAPEFIGNQANCKSTTLNCSLGNGKPGSAMAGYEKATTDVNYSDGNTNQVSAVLPTTKRYDELVSYTSLKRNAQTVLRKYPPKSEPVVTTLQDAKEIDTHSSPPTASYNPGEVSGVLFSSTPIK